MTAYLINGKTVEANSPEEAATMASQTAPPAATDGAPAPVTASGLGKAAATGLRGGTEAIPAMGGDIPSLIGRGVDWAGGKVGLPGMGEGAKTTAQAMISPGTMITKALQMAGVISPETAAKFLSVQAPTSADVASVTDPAVKKISPAAQEITRHIPQNKAEEAMQTTASLAPTLAAPGSLGERLALWLGSSGAVEGAGQATRALAPEYEDAARIVASFLVPGAKQAMGAGAAADFRTALSRVGTNPEAVAKVEQLLRDQGMSPQDIATRMREISPEAMPLDTGPNLRQEAQQIQAAGGAGGGTIDPLLRARELGSNRRLMEGVGANMGPYVERNQVLNALDQRASEAATRRDATHPQQQQPVDSQFIIDQLDTDLANVKDPSIRSTLQKVRNALHIQDQQGVVQGTLDPSSEGLQGARDAVKNMLYDQSGKKRDLGGKEGQLLDKYYAEINKAMDPANPAFRAEDANIEAAKKEGEAFQKGETVFSKEEGAQGPVSFAQEWGGLSAEQKAAAVKGATSKVYEKLGLFGKDRVKLNNLLVAEGKWPQEKLAMMIGDEKAQQLQQLLEGEGVMNESYNRIVQGSKTAETQRPGGQERPGLVKSAVEAAPGVVASTVVGGWPAGATVASGHLRKFLAETMTSRGTPPNDAAMAKILTTTRPDDIAELVRTMKANPSQNPTLMLNALLARRQDVEQRKDQ